MAKKEKMDAISTIVSAALAQGLSYGKYMAKYNYRPPCIYGIEQKKQKKPEDLDFDQEVTDKICVICGNAFPPGRSRQAKTCSLECSAALERMHQMLPGTFDRLHGRKCMICGAEIPETVHASRKVCSEACREEKKRRDSRERQRKIWQEKKLKPMIEKGEIEVNATGKGVSAGTWAAMQLLDPRGK